MISNKSKAELFVDKVAALRFRNCFNPYSDACAVHDLPYAPELRRGNLKAALISALDGGVDSLWVARDLGHKGGRRTGLALTDEASLEKYSVLLGAQGLQRATKGPAMSETTAKTIWRALGAVNHPVFLWNVFPLHPHTETSFLSNRKHTKIEGHACEDLLDWLIEELKPKTIVGIGNDAHSALELRYKIAKARHPSFGGANIFLADIARIYGLKAI